ncbi:MAG TPA: hypothetical protein VM347_06360 [Nonomuraea sp.]|nr:hypothetical protein [Nonomuraea sp.]
MSRAELHRALRAPLPAELVRTATPVQRLEPDPTGVTVISDGQPITRADAVIVADGIGSRLRGQLFPGHPGLRQVGRLDLRGMLPKPPGLDLTGLLAGILIDRRTGSMFGLFPVGESDLYWFTDSALQGTPPGADEARRGLLALMADWHPAVPALIEATPLADVYVDPIARLAGRVRWWRSPGEDQLPGGGYASGFVLGSGILSQDGSSITLQGLTGPVTR